MKYITNITQRRIPVFNLLSDIKDRKILLSEDNSLKFSDDDVKLFFDSIQKSYPLGTFVIWKNVYDHCKHYTVIDGTKRINALMLLYNENNHIYYDLETEKFYTTVEIENFETFVPINKFLNSLEFRKYFRNNFTNFDDDLKELYLDRADKLGQSFIQCTISCVDVISSIEELQTIINRLNK